MAVRALLYRFSTIGSWAIPVLLSLFPVLLGFWDLSSDRQRAIEEHRQNSLEQTNQAAQQLRACSDLAFWARETSRALRQDVEDAISGPSADSLEAACRKALLHPTLRGLPRRRLWAVEFPAGNVEQRGRLCGGDGLESSFKPVVQAIVPALARQHLDPQRPLHHRDELPRLRVMFGDMITPDLFSEDRRGQAFHTILQHSYTLIAWDLFFRHGKPVGGFILAFTVPHDPAKLALDLTFRNWNRYFSVPNLSCAFLSFPLAPGQASGSILCPPRLRRTDALGHLQELMRRQQITPNPNPDLLGSVRLLTGLVGRFESVGQWWFRVCPLHPQVGRVGVLCLPQPRLAMPPRERLAHTLLGLWLIGWGSVLFFRLLTGRLPAPGVRLGLVLWFFGLVSVPIMLTIITSASFLSNLESNLYQQRRQEMSQALREVEAGSMILGERYSLLFRSFTQRRDVWRQLLAEQRGTSKPKAVAERIWKDFADQEIPLMAILIYGHGGFTSHAFAPSTTPELQRALQNFIGEFGENTLRQADPDLYELYQKKQMAGGTGKPRQRQFEGLASSSFLLTQMDSASDFRMGRRHLMKYHNSMESGGHTHFVVFFIWDQDPLYRRYLHTAIPDANRQAQWLSLGAFRDRSEYLETIWRPRSAETLTQWAQQAREQTMWHRGPASLIYAYPSKRMPGYILAAQGSLQEVHDTVFNEARRLVLTLLSLLFLVGLSSVGLSHWLAQPILRMTEGLRQVSRGNLQIQVAETRDDEIGAAGTILDTMTDRLRERRLMSRFVAPQVLELIQNGTMDHGGSTVTQEAVALVSDIRNFTTLSETHPPAEVFAALNYHFQVMTRVIREQNGFIDRFIGDAIQAVFYPGDIPAAVRAVRAAAEMRQGHHLVQVHRRRQKKFEYEIGIGIDAGILVTGVLGNPDVRQEYSVLGEPMKHAAELEALSKLGKTTRIICSPTVVRDSGFPDQFEALPGDPNALELVQLPTEPV